MTKRERISVVDKREMNGIPEVPRWDTERSQWFFISIWKVCVCVCEREREGKGRFFFK